MKILFAHNCLLPIKKYGGTERILFWHMKELAKRNHQVYFIGPPGSQLSEYSIKYIPNIHNDWRLLIPKDIDIIHLYAPTSQWPDRPFLLTVEGNGQIGEVFPQNTVFVSRKHAENYGSTHYVHNALDLSEYPYRKKSGKSWKHFLFLAKAKWKVKNLKGCISAVKMSKKHLHIAGGRHFGISPRIHSYGMVGQKRKISLLNKTDALLFPVRWHEPFGIAIIEAMACGLPVIGSPYGSLPELINSSVGHICQNHNELVDILNKDQSYFNPDEIRNYIEEKFSISVLADKYLEYYEKVLSNQTLNPGPPKLQLSTQPETLLPF